jgi:hypothetical protein
MSNLFRKFFSTYEPELPCEFDLYGLDILVGADNRSALDIRKARKFLTKLRKISAVEVVEKFQDTLY